MAKSPKSWCCKVDAVNCKGFARRWFVLYWCVHFFQPCRVTIYALRTTRLQANYSTIYLHLKKTITSGNGKGVSQESKLHKTDTWPIDHHGLTCLHHAFHLAYLLDYRLLSFHRSVFRLTIGRSVGPASPLIELTPLTIGDSCWLPFSLSSIGRLPCFLIGYSFFILFDMFSKKRCQKLPP
jgi:hypothetical protein